MCKAPGMYSSTNAFGKANSRIDPMGAYINTGDKSKLDPARFGKIGQVDIPPPPPPMQDAKEPETMTERRNARQMYRNSGTLLGS